MKKKLALGLIILVSLLCLPPLYSQSTVTGWDIYDSTPAGTVTAVNDDGAAVFKLDNAGQGTETGYRYTFTDSPVSGKQYVNLNPQLLPLLNFEHQQ